MASSSPLETRGLPMVEIVHYSKHLIWVLVSDSSIGNVVMWIQLGPWIFLSFLQISVVCSHPLATSPPPQIAGL